MTKTPNPERGEVAITLHMPGDGGETKTFVMRPTFQAAAKIEARCQVGCVALMIRVAQSDVRLADMTVIIGEGLSAAGEPVNDMKLQEMVWRTGELALVDPVGQFLSRLVNGGRAPVPAGEAEPEGDKTEPIPSGDCSASRSAS